MHTPDTDKRHRSIALGGFMGVGKSTLGRALADRLGWPFVDLDAWLEDRHGPIPEQFARGGEGVFRRRETRAIALLCDGTQRVLATGGGAWVEPHNREALRTQYDLVVLDAPLEVLRARVSGAHRPNWSQAERLYEARRAAYADADLTLDATLPVEALVEEVLAWRS